MPEEDAQLNVGVNLKVNNADQVKREVAESMRVKIAPESGGGSRLVPTSEVLGAAASVNNSALRKQNTRDRINQSRARQDEIDSLRHSDRVETTRTRGEQGRNVLRDKDALHQDTQSRRVRRSSSLNAQEAEFQRARSTGASARGIRATESLANAQVSAQIGPSRRARRVAQDARAQKAEEGRSTFGGIMGRSINQTVTSPFSYYAAAQGNFGPAIGGVARGLVRAGESSISQYRSYMPGGANAAMPMAGMSGLASAAPFFAMGGAFALGGAAYLGASQLSASTNKDRQGLFASVGGTGFNQPALYNQLLGAGSRFNASPDTTMGIANSLGIAGVQGMSQANGQVQNTLGLGAVTGMDPSLLAGMTGKMATGGGMDAEQVGQAFGKMWQQVALTGTSIGKLTTNLQALQDATGGANINIGGLSAVTKLLPQGVNAGQLSAPLLSAAGSGGIVDASLLGVSQTRFNKMQSTGNIAGLMDLTSGFLKRATSGKSGAQRVELAETLNNSLGLLDMTGVTGANQAKVFSTLLNGKAGQFGSLANSLNAKTGMSGGDFRSAASAVSGADTGDFTQVVNTLKNLGDGVLNDIKDNTTGMLNWIVQNNAPGTAPGLSDPGGDLGGGVPGRRTPGYGSVRTGAASLTINRSTVPGGVANSAYSFNAGQIANIQAAAKQYGIPWQVLAAQIAREGGTPGSAAGGGIGQFIPSTAQQMINDPNSPVYGKPGFMSNYQQSTQAMAYYDSLLKKQTGSLGGALAAYNGSGPAAQAYSNDVIAGSQTIHVVGTLNDANGSPVGTVGSGIQRYAAGHRGTHAPTPVPGKRRQSSTDRATRH